jgi:GTP-binding protein LepA
MDGFIIYLLFWGCSGIQAQTLAHFYLAFGQDLTIIPVLNKVRRNVL